MGDSDLINLYSKRILALAADIPLCERLKNPDASAKRRSPLCGSTVEVDICVKNGRVTHFGQDVKACALGQAAASVVAGNIIARSHDEVQTARDQLLAMLKQSAPAPSAPFDGLEVLRPAREFKNRHASIMLVLDATLDALGEINNAG